MSRQQCRKYKVFKLIANEISFFFFKFFCPPPPPPNGGGDILPLVESLRAPTPTLLGLLCSMCAYKSSFERGSWWNLSCQSGLVTACMYTVRLLTLTESTPHNSLRILSEYCLNCKDFFTFGTRYCPCS